MRAIIAGSRNIHDEQAVRLLVELAISRGATEIVHGGCQGVDVLAGRVAIMKGLKVSCFFADWSIGRSAGPRRNAHMSRYADELFVLWDGQSRGTKDMIDRMKAKSKFVHTEIYGAQKNGPHD